MNVRLTLGKQVAIIVEFFGLPGAGKSTVAKPVHENLGPSFASSADILLDGQEKWKGWAKKTGLILPHALTAENRTLLGKAMKVRQSTYRNTIKALFPVATYLSLRSHLLKRNENAVFDQGLLQSAMSLVYGSVEDDRALAAIREFATWAAMNDEFHVVVDTPPDLCRTRLGDRARNHSRLGAEANDSWRQIERYYEAVKEELSAAYVRLRRTPRLIEVSGTDPIDQNAEEIVRAIKTVSDQAQR